MNNIPRKFLTINRQPKYEENIKQIAYLTYRKEGEGFEPILVHQNVVLNGQISLKVTPNINWYQNV